MFKIPYHIKVEIEILKNPSKEEFISIQNYEGEEEGLTWYSSPWSQNSTP